MTDQPRQEFDLRYPVRTQPDGGPCWCMSVDEPHEDWIHSPVCSEMFRWWWAARPRAIEVERLREAIYAISVRHDWANTVDTEDRTEEIAAEYAQAWREPNHEFAPALGGQTPHPGACTEGCMCRCGRTKREHPR